VAGGRVWVNARSEDRAAFEAAVNAGGGELCAPEDANTIVWAVDDPPAIRKHLGPGIRWVQLSSAGIEDWFKAGVVDDGRVWTAAKGAYAGPIAEYVVAVLLVIARRLHHAVRATRWQPLEISMLSGQTLGVVGAGGIGAAALRLVAPFGVRGIALTRSGRVLPGVAESVGPDGLDDLLRRSDFVLLAVPETPETIGLLGADRLALLSSHAWIINVGRGSIVDTDALVDALERGTPAGAVLDVTDPEPLQEEHPLWRLPNAIITSHSSCTLPLARAAFADRVQTNVARFLRGEPLLGVVDVGDGY